MEEEFDEEFGDDVLPTSIDQQSSSMTTTAPVIEEDEEEEDEDLVLYGNMTEVPVENNPEDEDELEEEDEGIAIVLKDTTESPSKPQLRFTRGDNRYVRGDHVSPQLQPSVPRTNEQFDPSFDELALLGIGGRRTAFDVDIDALDDKPWRKPGVDISDYFNYGFDEAIWREYCIKQQQNRRELAYQKSQEKEAEEKEKAKVAATTVPDVSAYMPPMGGMNMPRGAPPPHMMFRGPPGPRGSWGGAPPSWSGGPPQNRPKEKDSAPSTSNRSKTSDRRSRSREKQDRKSRRPSRSRSRERDRERDKKRERSRDRDRERDRDSRSRRDRDRDRDRDRVRDRDRDRDSRPRRR